MVQINPDEISEEWVGRVSLYYDDGPYVSGPIIQVNDTCWVYSFSFINEHMGTPITEKYAYYIPRDNTSIIFRRNSYNGEKYHGGHLVILKEEDDKRFDSIKEQYFNGGILVKNKSTDPISLAFEAYIRSMGSNGH